MNNNNNDFMRTHLIQSITGQTDKQRVHPVQSSVTCGMCVLGSKLIA